MVFKHGVTSTQTSSGTRPIRTTRADVIGMVCTADDADAALFPLNKAVLINSQSALGKAGTTGTLRNSLDAIFDQIVPYVIVVRVAEDVDPAIQQSNIIGGVLLNGDRTGIQALLGSKAKFGFKPRILGVPEFSAQAITSELVIIADKLKGFAYAEAIGDAKEDAVLYRANFGSKRLMLIWSKWLGLDGGNNETTIDPISRALGMRAKIDDEIGWHKTLSNIEVNGVLGIQKDIYFDLQESATDANYLNENEVTTMIKQDGFRYWGNRTCSNDPHYAFEVATRTGDILEDTIAEAHFFYIDLPLSKQLIKEIVESINAKFRAMKAEGKIVNAAAWIDPDLNTVENLEQGKLYIKYDFTPVPPLENPNFTQIITNTYLSELVA